MLNLNFCKMFKNRFDLRKVAAIAACLAVTIGFASCEKDDLNTDTVDVKLLDTETSGLFHSRKFVYDEQNRMKEIWTYSGGVLYEKAFITYTGEDLTKLEYAYLDKGDFVVVDTRNYVKNGNTIRWSVGVVIIEGEGEGNQDFKSTITLNDDGFPEKLEQVLFNTTSVSAFSYVNGNLTKYTYDTVFSSSMNDPGERNYTYSANRSAYSGCKTPKWFMFLHFYEMASHNSVTASYYSYEFDKDKFPTKRITKNANGSQEITEYKYHNIDI